MSRTVWFVMVNGSHVHGALSSPGPAKIASLRLFSWCRRR